MPKWGLTNSQRESRPWGLSSELLRPRKTITNSVQGDVYLNELELRFLDSPPLQRLRRVRQLGTTHEVYPDGTHTRFSHVIGALRVAQDLLDAVLGQRDRPAPPHDLFQDWREHDPETYDHKIAEVVVLTRLGALLHDLGHVPFGHTLEDSLGLLVPHDKNVPRFEHLWSQLPTDLRTLVSGRLELELRRLILSKEVRAADYPPSEYPFVEDLVGNTICADLLDYLPRDFNNLGLPMRLGHRFLEGLWITHSTHPHHRQRAAIEIERKGRQREDVVTELTKYLRYRYEESERALMHHAKLATDAMIGKLLAMWRDAAWVDRASELLGPIPAETRKDIDEVRSWLSTRPRRDLLQAARRVRLVVQPGSATTDLVAGLISQIDASVVTELEEQLLRHGDDGLLEQVLRENEIYAIPSQTSYGTDSRRAAIAELCGSVINRQLYKPIASTLPEDIHLAKSLWDQYGKPDDRRRLELEAASYLGLEDKWHFVLWLPSPEMKLKPAMVLVGAQGGDSWVSTLHDHSDRVRDIYRSHENLWKVTLFAHPQLCEDRLRRGVLLAWMQKRLGLKGWTDARTQPSVTEVAVAHFAEQRDLKPSQVARLSASIAARSPNERDTLPALMSRLEMVAATARSSRR